MQVYHDSNSLSSGEYSDDRVRNTTDDRRALRPYEVIATPPITLILYAIVARCRVGGCITPGVRLLAELAGVSPGIVSPCLYELARDGWISYDGRVIMLLIDPDHDGDRDHDEDRSFARSEPIDLRRDRFESDMVLTAANRFLDSESAARSKIPCSAENDQPPDHRALLLAELGAGQAIIRDALAARPDLTLEQIRASWSHFEPRIKAGLCTAGAFCDAIRRGQLHSAPHDPHRPIDPQSYANDPAFRLGSDVRGLERDISPPASAPPIETDETPSQAARRVLPEGATNDDFIFVCCRLACGDDEATALAELAQHRSAVRR